MHTMHDTKQFLEDIDMNASVVSVIIEREHAGEREVLVQTRWKPERDPQYSGTLEIPAGGIHAYENVYEAVRREVREETGLRVTPGFQRGTQWHVVQSDPGMYFHPDYPSLAFQLEGSNPHAGLWKSAPQPACSPDGLRHRQPAIGRTGWGAANLPATGR